MDLLSKTALAAVVVALGMSFSAMTWAGPGGNPSGGASSCAPGKSDNPPPGQGGSPPGQTCKANKSPSK